MASSADQGSSTPSTRLARQVIAPLTTAYQAPQDCSFGTYEGCTTTGTALYHIVSMFNSDQMCQDISIPICFPHVTAYSDISGAGFFYSPGLACPAGWVTAATVTSGQAGGSVLSGVRQGGSLVSGVRVETLLPSETAAVCCPRDFTYVPDEADGVNPAVCVQYNTANGAYYSSCDSQNVLAPVTLSGIGKATGDALAGASGSYSWTSTYTKTFSGVMSMAPTMQINYRPQDLGSTSQSAAVSAASETGSAANKGEDINSNLASSSPSKLSGGAIAGIVVGVVALLAGLGLMVFLLRKRRKRSSSEQTPDAPETAGATANGPSADRDGYGKPELDGAVKGRDRDIPFKAELEGKHEPRYELDGGSSMPGTTGHPAEAHGESISNVRNSGSKAN